jgi:hypothetical protein
MKLEDWIPGIALLNFLPAAGLCVIAARMNVNSDPTGALRLILDLLAAGVAFVGWRVCTRKNWARQCDFLLSAFCLAASAGAGVAYMAVSTKSQVQPGDRANLMEKGVLLIIVAAILGAIVWYLSRPEVMQAFGARLRTRSAASAARLVFGIVMVVLTFLSFLVSGFFLILATGNIRFG